MFTFYHSHFLSAVNLILLVLHTGISMSIYQYCFLSVEMRELI